MIPIFIKILKALHPAQNPMKASNEANEISIVNKTIEILFNPTTWKLVISKEKTSPTPCANLLGGPGTIFSLKFIFLINLLYYYNFKYKQVYKCYYYHLDKNHCEDYF